MRANSKTITFRVDDPTYGYFRQLADARAMTMSRFMRYLIVEMANLALNRTETGIGIDEPDCENCKVNHKEYGCPIPGCIMPKISPEILSELSGLLDVWK